MAKSQNKPYINEILMTLKDLEYMWGHPNLFLQMKNSHYL